MRLRPGQEAAYDEAHRHVWPELLAELSAAGVREYSIFRHEQDLFLYLRVPDFDHLQRRMAASEVDRRWQQRMAPLFEAVLSAASGERLVQMQEVFYMPGEDAPLLREPHAE